MDLQIFTSEQFGEIRMTMVNGEPWFVAKDVAVALGYSNPPKAVRDHVANDDKTVNESFTVNGTKVVLINESGLYSLILSSKLPKSVDFKHWVTSEVLPSIRKMGSYSTQNCAQFPPKATSVGEVASIIKTLQSVMKHQNSHPVKIAVMAEGLCHQFGINIPDDFVERSPREQIELAI